MDEDVPSIGVEEEFLLVDSRTGIPVNKNREVAAAARELGIDLQLELAACQVETATGVHHGIDELTAELRWLRREVARCARKFDATLLAVGVSPIGPSPMAVTRSERYQRIEANFGLLADEQPLCGGHVHVAVSDREIAIQVCNYLRPWLPLLLALTANSAVQHGADTGYASWRSVLWHRWPSAGPPPYFTSAHEYDAMVSAMRTAGSILDEKMVYWDVRPSTSYPTVEIRVSDVPATVAQSALLAALIRAGVVTARDAVRHNRICPAVTAEMLRIAYWKAARDGAGGDCFDPVDGRIMPFRRRIAEFVDLVAPALDRLGDRDFVDRGIERVLEEGNGARRQVEAERRCGGGELVTELAALTLEGC
ncbi:carboxylate-amine ligase [Nocardia pseudobrasiliensis]|uniref:Putative glutamate--cysteine ligase 2 n=1 Tax=Nocardia pseudobrasiliensis TaxID=45979 RepID=A0A370HXU1_9NOCA|nr:glutamate--cysteine ligase [Nocardia pseudobrasiliensis]RDI62731.1 carboxylate-amine ligase [Nocardia pseudobrasiliensis]